MDTLVATLVWLLSGALIFAIVRRLPSFRPVGPQRVAPNEYRLFSARRWPVGRTLLLALPIVGSLVGLSFVDRLGAIYLAVLLGTWFQVRNASWLAQEGFATRGRLAHSSVFICYVPAVGFGMHRNMGYTFGLETVNLVSAICLASALTLALIGFGIFRTRNCILFMAASFAVLLGFLWSDRRPLDEISPRARIMWEVLPSYERTTRADVLRRLEQGVFGESGWNSRHTAQLQFLSLDGGPMPDLVHVKTAFRKEMNESVVAHTPQDGSSNKSFSYRTDHLDRAELLGLFTPADYEIIRAQVPKSTLLRPSRPFKPCADDVLIYGFLEAGELSEQEQETLAEKAQSYLPTPGTRRALEAYIRMDRLFKRLGKDEMRIALRPLAKLSLEATWHGYGPNGDARFASEQSDTEKSILTDPWSLSYGWSLSHGTCQAVLAMDYFGLMDEFDLVALQNYLVRRSIVESASDEPEHEVAAALSLLESWPAYAAQKFAPHVLSPDELAMVQERQDNWYTWRRRAPFPSSPKELFSILVMSFASAINLLVLLRARRPSPG